MKLLFDQNLSHKLPTLLAIPFPGSKHVREYDLQNGEDKPIWDLAARDGFTIVTKDDDFLQLSAVHGAPPKLVLLRIGNASTQDVVALLLANVGAMRSFGSQDKPALLVLAARRT